MSTVTRENAIKFLESACRNWSRVPPLVEDDLADVANALRDFMRKHAQADEARVKQLEEALRWARANYASGSTREINARIDAAVNGDSNERA